jgi:hypothetical protein
MKDTLLICLLLQLFASCKEAHNTKQEMATEKSNEPLNMTENKIDTTKSTRSLAVVKAKLITSGGGEKFVKDSIEVLEVIQNQTSYKFPKRIDIARYSFKEGIPENKECILYLTAFPFGATELNEQNEWMLLEGDGAYACECK